MKLDRDRESTIRGGGRGNIREVYGFRKVHISKNIWNVVPSDRRSVNMKTVGFGN